MIKYLGSKRLLVPVIETVAAVLAEEAGCAGRAVDPFTGTTRVAQALARGGWHVHAGDAAAYAATFARCYVEADPTQLDVASLDEELARLSALPGEVGYVTRTFAREARYLQEHNARRIDAIRTAIEQARHPEPVRSILLTSLVEAADRVDSTTGVQMAYLKGWSARSAGELQLRRPEPAPGAGRAWEGDALDTVRGAGRVELAYLDPPYNQHSYLGNYHVWETIVRADEPEAYGVARKRVDVRERRSPYNSRRHAAGALGELVAALDARHVLASLSVEGHVTRQQLVEMLAARGEEVAVLEVAHPRYVGARIGIHDRQGRRVGTPGATSTTELLALAGPGARRVLERVAAAGHGAVAPDAHEGHAAGSTSAAT